MRSPFLLLGPLGLALTLAAPVRGQGLPPLVVPKASGPARRAPPMTVRPFHGQYCAGVGPRGWSVVAENAQRVAFGADFQS